MSKIDTNNVERIVRQKLAMFLGDNMTVIGADEPIIESVYEIDSIIVIQVLVELESEFDFDFDDEQLIPETMSSVSTLTNAVLKHIE